MNHQHEPDFTFPSGLSDREATTLCEFLFQLAADAEARYLGQILRYQRQTDPTPRNPDRPWDSDPNDF
jgi:hypothetical protein